MKLIEYIEAIETALGEKARLQMLPLQPGDVPDTFADVSELKSAVDYKPSTPVTKGVANLVEWYLTYFKESRPSAS